MFFAPLHVLLALALRSAIVLLVLLAGFRVLGKRSIAAVNVYDLVMVAAVANAVQNAMTQGRGELTVGLASAGALLLVGRLLTLLFIRMPTLQDRLIGTPTVIINNGHLVRANMERERVEADWVMATLRNHGLRDPDQVKLAVLEVDGTLSVVPFERQR